MSVMTQLIIQLNDSVKKYLKLHLFFIWPSGPSFKTEIVLFIRTVIIGTAILTENYRKYSYIF